MQNPEALGAVRQRTARSMHLQDLVSLLRGVSESEFVPETIAELLNGVRVEHGSLTNHLHWKAKSYTRNLIYRDEVFELLAVCWEPGSCSPVHDHAGQDCWLAVHQGHLDADSFELVNPNDTGRVGDNIAVRRLGCRERVEPTRVDHRGPANDIHRVINRHALGKRAISLHIYARPFDSCVTYDTQKDTASLRTMSYDTISGLRTSRS